MRKLVILPKAGNNYSPINEKEKTFNIYAHSFIHNRHRK